MKMTIILQVALLALVPSVIYAQQTTPAPESQTTPVTQPAQSGESGLPMTKKELKAQRDQQKKEEKAAKANAKAAKSTAKAKEDQDKALQKSEQAQPTTPAATPQQ